MFFLVGGKQRGKQNFNYSKLKNEIVEKPKDTLQNVTKISSASSNSIAEGPLIDFSSAPPPMPLLDVNEIPSYSNITSVLDQPIDVPQQQGS